MFSMFVTDEAGCSLLHWAAINQRYDVAVFLISQGMVVLESSKSYYLHVHIIYSASPPRNVLRCMLPSIECVE